MTMCSHHQKANRSIIIIIIIIIIIMIRVVIKVVVIMILIPSLGGKYIKLSNNKIILIS